MRSSRFGLWLLIAALCSQLQASPSLARNRWIGSWASAQMLLDAKDGLPAIAGGLTVRQLIRTTLAGGRARLTISNTFGRTPLTIEGADIARAVSANSSTIDPATNHILTFRGRRSVTIPAGSEYVSDPIAMVAPALTTVAVSLHFADLPNFQTGHPGSRATSYVAVGDQASEAQLKGATTVDRWFFVAGLDVERASPAAAIAVLGDSITDGHGVASNTDTRWPDYLADRLQRSTDTRSLSVLNLGIGGNRMIEDGLGPNATARFNRDVLARAGVRYLIILEGVNDLGVLTRDAPASPEAHRALVQHLLDAYAQIIARARDRGIKVIAGTIMPYGASSYYHPTAANEADRAEINGWQRAPGHADAIIDFDAIMRDPAHPERLRPDLDSGDGLHPSAAGYRLMGNAVPLSLFTNRSRN